MKHLQQMCKCNNASHVKTIAPATSVVSAAKSALPSIVSVYYLDSLADCLRKGVDNRNGIDIIIFTHWIFVLGGADGETTPQRSQAQQPASARNPQPPPPGGDRRLLPERRVFR